MILRFSQSVTFPADLNMITKSDYNLIINPSLSPSLLPHFVLSSAVMLSAFSWVCTASRNHGNRPTTGKKYTLGGGGKGGGGGEEQRSLTCRQASLAVVIIVPLKPVRVRCGEWQYS